MYGCWVTSLFCHILSHFRKSPMCAFMCDDLLVKPPCWTPDLQQLCCWLHAKFCWLHHARHRVVSTPLFFAEEFRVRMCKNFRFTSFCLSEIYNFGLIHQNSMCVLVKFYFWMVRSNISGAKIYLIHSNFGASRLFCSALPRALWNIHLTYPIKLSYFKHLQTISFPKTCSKIFFPISTCFPPNVVSWLVCTPLS